MASMSDITADTLSSSLTIFGSVVNMSASRNGQALCSFLEKLVSKVLLCLNAI